MAKAAGAVNVMCVASVDPDLDIITIFQAGVAAPWSLQLPRHQEVEEQSFCRPGNANIGEFSLAI